MVLEVLLPCDPFGGLVPFFFDLGKNDKSGSFRNMHILDVLCVWIFISNILLGTGIFVQLHAQLEVPHFFCVILFVCLEMM